MTKKLSPAEEGEIAAAPDLLETLKLMVDAASAVHGGEKWDATVLAKKIIARAEGRG